MKRPRAHEIGDQAEKRLNSVLPDAWVIRPIAKDYGVDFEVELVDQHIVSGNRIWVQLKGTTALRHGTATFRPKVPIDGVGESIDVPFVSFALRFSPKPWRWTSCSDRRARRLSRCSRG